MTAINIPQEIAQGVYYYPHFLDDPDDALQEVREQVAFVQRSRSMYGRQVATPRQEAWFGPKPYRFGGSELPSAPLPQVLKVLAIRTECFVTGASFDSCLVNRYRDGNDSVGWHADDEPEMGDPIIASISLGAPRDFLLRAKTSERASNRAARLAGAPWATRDNLKITLEHGSMIVMARGVQSKWEHCLPKRPKVSEERINLTFRDCRAK